MHRIKTLEGMSKAYWERWKLHERKEAMMKNRRIGLAPSPVHHLILIQWTHPEPQLSKNSSYPKTWIIQKINTTQQSTQISTVNTQINTINTLINTAFSMNSRGS